MIPLTAFLAFTPGPLAVPPAQFASFVGKAGYHLDPLPNRSDAWVVSNGKLRATLFGWKTQMGNIGDFNLYLELDLPRALNSATTRNLATQRSLAQLEIQRYLDGGVVLKSPHRHSGNGIQADVKPRLDQFFEGLRDFRTVLPVGRPLLNPMEQPPSIPVDLKALITLPNERDLLYIERQFGWVPKHAWGGSSNGWILPSTILGVDVWFHESVNREANGVAPSRSGCQIYVDLRASDAIWTTRWVASHKQSIKWARVEDEGAGRLIIRAFLDTTGGISVAALKAKVLDFASHIRQLNLPNSVR